MNGNILYNRGLVVVAAVGGVVIGGAAVILVYQQLFGDQKQLRLQQDIDKLNNSVSEIRRELNALRNQTLKNRTRRQTVGTASVAETEMFSVGPEDLDDEFYDFSSDNETIVDEAKESSFEDIDKILDGKSKEDKIKAYGLLLELIEKGKEDGEVLWRLAKSCHVMGSMYGAEGNKDKKKEFVYKGVEYGKKAMEINHSNWNAHKWFAICVGARGEMQSVKNKLRDGHLFKEHLDLAIRINPKDPTLHHMLGRFNYEVAGLSWLERKVANTLFGEVPQGTYKDAINSLLEAERHIGWKENRLLLSKCYIAEQEYKQALFWLDSANDIPAISLEEQLANKEIDALLKKYNSYRGLEA